MPVPVFCCFWFQKSYTGNILGIDKGNYFTKFYTGRLQKPEGEPEGGHRVATPLGAPSPLAAPGCGVGPLDRLRLRLSAYLFTPDGKTLNIAQKFQKEVRSRRHRLGEIRSSSRHSAGGEIITGGLLHHHARLRSDV